MMLFMTNMKKLNAFLHSHSYTANPIACSAANGQPLPIFLEIKVTINGNRRASRRICE